MVYSKNRRKDIDFLRKLKRLYTILLYKYSCDNRVKETSPLSPNVSAMLRPGILSG